MAQVAAPVGSLPPLQNLSQRQPGHGLGIQLQEFEIPQMEHHFGDAAGQEDANGRMVSGAVGEDIHNAWHLAVYSGPVGRRRPLEPGSMGYGRQVQEQVGGSAKGGMHRHRIVNGFFSQQPTRRPLLFLQKKQGPGRPASHVEPDLLARGCQGRMRQGQAQGFPHDLGGCRRPQKLAAAARRSAGPAECLGRILQSGFAVGKTSSNGLDRAGILSLNGRQSHSSRYQNTGQITG